jgi:hypothetical protein
MVKVVNNSPNFIGITPVQNNQTMPTINANSSLSDIEGYIKLIDKALELFTKFNDIKSQFQNKQVSQTINVESIPVNKEVVNTVNNTDINADFILGVLKQIDTMKEGITVKEVITLVEQNKETLNNIIKMNIGVK